ncbi:MAG: 5-oxoprolinase subunit PxpB [Arenicella sp.]
MQIKSISENSLIIYFGQEINTQTHSKVTAAVALIERNLNEIIIDLIPSYNSIHITYDINKVLSAGVRQLLRETLQVNTEQESTKSNDNIIEIPVYYGADVSLDLSYISQQTELSEQEVIDIHSSKTYNVFAIGFSPGFAYLGNVDERIALPRKTTPRTKIAAGSLGIADQQTAIYPSESPGGWQIIGRTPVSLVDYASESLTPFTTGDQVRFKPIDRAEFIQLGGVL